MKNKQKVWIRGVEGRGDEVINALKALGGKLTHGSRLSGEDDTCIYSITHKGFLCAIPAEHEVGKIVMDCYREIKLSERWKDGAVVFSSLTRAFAVCTEKEDTQYGEVLTHFVLSENAIYYNRSIRKRDYRLANKKKRKIFLERLHKLGKDWDAENKQLVDWRWKPKNGETIYYFDEIGQILSDRYDDFSNSPLSDFGNCFRTREEAEAAVERVKKALKGI